MALLFKPEHVPLILSGRKTQTRRLWKKRRVVPGSVHPCYTRPPFARGGAEPFAYVLVRRTWQEPLESISEADAIAEGYPNREEYLKAFHRINRTTPEELVGILPWCVEFEMFKGWIAEIKEVG